VRVAPDLDASGIGEDDHLQEDLDLSLQTNLMPDRSAALSALFPGSSGAQGGFWRLRAGPEAATRAEGFEWRL
jgi:hypothetical protein